MSAETTETTDGQLPGAFIISLDFELFWGVHDNHTIKGYGENILGVRNALPAMLDGFARHGVKATFATVGLLFFHDRKDMMAGLPSSRPTYLHTALSPYTDHIQSVGENEKADPYHFGASLLEQILAHPGHEIGCHTFSHYYCLERGQTAEQFAADLNAARTAAQDMGILLRSLVFPRNQHNPDYMAICRQYGIEAYRGNEDNWLHTAKSGDQETLLRRAIRLMDTWINLTGHNCHPWPKALKETPMNIPASRFLRPWNSRTAALEGLRLKRITKAMDHAARTGTLFHLWWHPHNFGRNLDENMDFLGKVLQHYDRLRQEQGMVNLTMGEMASRINVPIHGN